MGWWITLGILTLLAILPLGVSIRYDEDGAVIRVILGPVKFKVYPKPKKEKKEEKAEKVDSSKEKESQKSGQKGESAQEGKEEQKKEEKPREKSGGPISDFFPLIRIILDFLGAFGRRLRLNLLELKLIMAADDPCDLAVNYGRAWAAVGNLLPQLEKIFVIKKRNVEVLCDFEASQTRVTARLDLTMTLGRLLATVLVYGGKAGLELMKINKKRKGGASQ